MGFKMEPGKNGRLKYLILTILPAVLTMNLIGKLAGAGILPTSDLTGFLSMSLSLILMGTLGYFLILRKNHTLDFSDISVAEKDWQGNCRIIAAGRIRSRKKNLLGETLLLDEKGKVLLCVESNMENIGQFEQWLNSRNITEKEN